MQFGFCCLVASFLGDSNLLQKSKHNIIQLKCIQIWLKITSLQLTHHSNTFPRLNISTTLEKIVCSLTIIQCAKSAQAVLIFKSSTENVLDAHSNVLVIITLQTACQIQHTGVQNEIVYANNVLHVMNKTCCAKIARNVLEQHQLC